MKLQGGALYPGVLSSCGCLPGESAWGHTRACRGPAPESATGQRVQLPEVTGELCTVVVVSEVTSFTMVEQVQALHTVLPLGPWLVTTFWFIDA